MAKVKKVAAGPHAVQQLEMVEYMEEGEQNLDSQDGSEGTNHTNHKSPTVAAAIRRTWLWNHFERLPDNNAKCFSCGICVRPKMPSLTRHLREFHDATPPHDAHTMPPPGIPALDRLLSRQTILDNTLVVMLAKDFHAPSIVEMEGFRRFLSALDPNYIIPNTQKVIELLDEKYNFVKERVKTELATASNITLTLESWSSSTIEMCSYMVVTAHFIDTDWILKTVNLGTFKINQNLSIITLGQIIGDVMTNWNISGNVKCIVAQNPSSMMEALQKMLLIQHIPCFSHKFNSIIKDVLSASPSFAVIRQKARSIVAYFKTNHTARDKLESLKTDTDKMNSKLIQEVDIRWNSTYEMLVCLRDQKAYITKTLELVPNGPANLTSDEWEILGEVAELLIPMAQLTDELSSEKFVLSSKITPMINQLCKILTEKKSSDEKDTTQELRCKFINHFEEKCITSDLLEFLEIATILDPRFKTIAFMKTDTEKDVIDKLITICAALMDEANPNASATRRTTRPTDGTSSNSPFWQSFDEEVQKRNDSHNTLVDASVEVQKYLAEKYLHRSDNPLDFWWQNRLKYPFLSRIARKHLTVASAIPPAQIFTKRGQIICKQRSQMKGKHISKVLFMNRNHVYLQTVTPHTHGTTIS